MKPNVDLTLNRDFRDEPERRIFRNSNGIVAMIYNFVDPKKPWLAKEWNEITDDAALRTEEKSNLLFTGNKTERAKKKFYDSERDDTVCYCCGKKIKTPWKNRFRVCEHCDDSDNRGDKVIWRR